MSDDRPWYREPETFVAVAALIVSISAVAVGIYEAALQRKHDRAEVWPHLEISTFTSPHVASVRLENNGIGPAVVQSVIVRVDGKPMHTWAEAVQTLIGRPMSRFDNATAAQRGIRAGDNVPLIVLPTDSLPPGFWDYVKRVSIKVCYTSVFDEAWLLSDDSLGSGSTWQSVAKCAPQPKGFDF